VPTLRKRLLVDEWVILAPERAGRPRRLDLVDQDRQDDPKSNIPCPFCVENGELTPAPSASWPSPSFPDHPWGVRSVPNKYPALSPDADEPAQSDRLYVAQAARGVHEVIVESPCHHQHWEEIPQEHVTAIFGAWRDRLQQLGCDLGHRCALIYKNQGARAGATLEHIHSQLSALPFIPPALDAELSGARTHFETTGQCAFCEMMERERRSGERLIAETDHIVALAPYGSRVPFEVWILPRAHSADFSATTDHILSDLAEMTAKILSLWRPILGSVAHNMILHSVPFDLAGKPYYHWHLELLPRLGQVAGFEWASRIFINATPSEVAAQRLRSLCR
jgi:UDPglucose--hexose-1-phosphate uridylyltransferase